MQSGSFGKLNKKISFPESLDLSPYMSEPGENNDLYKLYAVIVHIDMLNASFFGHYICYIKDFRGNWYRIDDCQVKNFCSFSWSPCLVASFFISSCIHLVWYVSQLLYPYKSDITFSHQTVDVYWSHPLYTKIFNAPVCWLPI